MLTAHGRAFVLRKLIDLCVLQKVLLLTIMKNDQTYCLGEEKLKIKSRCAVNYDGPKWLTFHFHTTSQFRILNSEICTANFGIRNCEVYIIWANGNS